MRTIIAALAFCALATGAHAQSSEVSYLNPPGISDLGTYTIATLPTCDSTIGKKTAWATDLFGQSPGDRVVCDGVGKWKPVRPLAVSMAITSNMTLDALTSAPTLIAGVTSLNLSGWTCYQFDGTSWVQTKSGGLL